MGIWNSIASGLADRDIQAAIGCQTAIADAEAKAIAARCAVVHKDLIRIAEAIATQPHQGRAGDRSRSFLNRTAIELGQRTGAVDKGFHLSGDDRLADNLRTRHARKLCGAGQAACEALFGAAAQVVEINAVGCIAAGLSADKGDRVAGDDRVCVVKDGAAVDVANCVGRAGIAVVQDIGVACGGVASFPDYGGTRNAFQRIGIAVGAAACLGDAAAAQIAEVDTAVAAQAIAHKGNFVACQEGLRVAAAAAVAQRPDRIAAEAVELHIALTTCLLLPDHIRVRNLGAGIIAAVVCQAQRLSCAAFVKVNFRICAAAALPDYTVAGNLRLAVVYRIISELPDAAAVEEKDFGVAAAILRGPDCIYAGGLEAIGVDLTAGDRFCRILLIPDAVIVQISLGKGAACGQAIVVQKQAARLGQVGHGINQIACGLLDVGCSQGAVSDRDCAAATDRNPIAKERRSRIVFDTGFDDRGIHWAVGAGNQA